MHTLQRKNIDEKLLIQNLGSHISSSTKNVPQCKVTVTSRTHQFGQGVQLSHHCVQPFSLEMVLRKSETKSMKFSIINYHNKSTS